MSDGDAFCKNLYYIACKNYVTNEQINFLQRIAQLEKVYMFLILLLFDNQF